MSQYIIVYLGGEHPSSPEEGKAHFEKYKQWLGSLGEAVVSPANPLKDTHTVDSGGAVSKGGSIGMSGYTVVQADSVEAALDMAKNCPFLDIGGTLEVSELVQMSM